MSSSKISVDFLEILVLLIEIIPVRTQIIPEGPSNNSEKIIIVNDIPAYQPICFPEISYIGRK